MRSQPYAADPLRGGGTLPAMPSQSTPSVIVELLVGGTNVEIDAPRSRPPAARARLQERVEVCALHPLPPPTRAPCPPPEAAGDRVSCAQSSASATSLVAERGVQGDNEFDSCGRRRGFLARFAQRALYGGACYHCQAVHHKRPKLRPTILSLKRRAFTRPSKEGPRQTKQITL